MATVRGIAGVMSKVISFRLDPDNPREARALDILEQWREEGFSLRHTVTEAILSLDNPKSMSQKLIVEEELLRTINGLLRNLLANNSEPLTNQRQVVSDNFKASLKMSIKPGLKLN